MPLKTFCFSTPLYIEGIRKNLWLPAIYGLILFMAVPYAISTNQLGPEPLPEFVSALLHLANIQWISTVVPSPYQNLLLLTVPIVAGVLAFRPLMHKGQSDLILSLPATRSALFSSSYASGLTLFATPVLLNGLILLFLKLAMGIHAISIMDLGLWLGFTLLMGFLLYNLCIFSGVILGVSMLQALFTGILIILPAGIMLLLEFCFSNLVYGYSYSGREFKILTPVYRIWYGCNFERLSTPFAGAEIAIYLGICVITLLAAAWLFQRRPAENSGQPVAFPSLQPLLKYLASFCCALLASNALNPLFSGSLDIYIGYFIGGLMGYVLAEMIIRKSIRGWIPLKGLAASMTILTVAAALLHYDVTGFQRWTPEAASLTSISVQVSPLYQNGTGVFKDKRNLERMTALHRELLKNKGSQNYQDGEWVSFVFHTIKDVEYHRSYNISEERYRDFWEPIHDSPEGKRLRSPILGSAADNVQLIRITPQNGNQQILISEPNQIQKALEALKQDRNQDIWQPGDKILIPWAELAFEVTSAKAIDGFDTTGYGSSDNIAIQDKYLYRDSYFTQFLADASLLEKSRFTTKQVRTILIQRLDTPESITLFERNRTLTPNQPGVHTITNPAEIQACLDTPAYYYTNEQEFNAYTLLDSKSQPIGDGIFLKDALPFLEMASAR